MDDAPVTEPRRGRSLLIVLAIIAIVAASIGAAWLAMPEERTDESGTKVLSASIDRPPAASTSTSTTAAPTSATGPGAATALATTTSTTAPITSTGRFAAAAGTGEVRGTGDVHTYSVETEEGSGVSPDELGAIVDVILADSRGWTGEGYAFQRVPSGGSFTISLATPATTDQICQPLDTAGRFSCHDGHRVVLNLTRWNEGTADLPLDLNEYRAEVVNHEVGHELGFGHVGCQAAGRRAPVMMQQSKGLDGCVANPWPTLDGT